MRSTEEIKKDLEGLKADLAKWGQEKAEAEKVVEQARRVRDEHAFISRRKGDAKAQQRLKDARAAQREAELTLEDVTTAIAQGEKTFAELQAELAEADYGEEVARLEAEVEGICADLDEAGEMELRRMEKLREAKRRLSDWSIRAMSRNLVQSAEAVDLRYEHRWHVAQMHGVDPHAYPRGNDHGEYAGRRLGDQYRNRMQNILAQAKKQTEAA